MSILDVNKKPLVALISLGLFGLSANSYGEDLGLIKIESSTITTKEQTQTEASTVSTIDEETIKIIDPKLEFQFLVQHLQCNLEVSHDGKLPSINIQKKSCYILPY